MYSKRDTFKEAAGIALDSKVLQTISDNTTSSMEYYMKRPGWRVKRRVYIAEAIKRGLLSEAPPFLGT